ncbi:DUF378 domain-containing protein [Pedomonas sp. V897]|mgnify:CR=1 FL=1|uniref:DUF378 domain-containing protein n=1 Tax=Pedomonas sp. V897 TaxID=3446482 RepID=UPI003EDED341
MKTLNLITLILTIIGGINWGLIALADFNLVTALFGVDTTLTNIVYALVGLSALYQLIPFVRAWQLGEVRAESAH